MQPMQHPQQPQQLTTMQQMQHPQQMAAGNAFTGPAEPTCQRNTLVLGAVVSGIIGVCMICGAFLANTPSAYVFLLLGGIVVSIVSCVFCGCICCQERSVVIVNQTHLDGPASAPAFPAQAYLQHASYPVPMHQPAFPEVPTAQQVTSAYVPRTSA